MQFIATPKMELGGVVAAAATATALTVVIEAENENANISMLYEPRYRPPLPPSRVGDNFMLNQFTEVECREYFRFLFTQAEIRQILPYLGLDEIVYRQRRRTAPPELAFCLSLKDYRAINASRVFLLEVGHGSRRGRLVLCQAPLTNAVRGLAQD